MQVNDLILELATEANEKYQCNNWIYVSTELGKRYGIVKTPNACKKTYQRINKKLDKPIEPKIQQDNKQDIKETLNKGSRIIQLLANGMTVSERRILLSESQLKSKELLLVAHGFDTNEFELVTSTNNLWDSQTSEGEILTLYQSKITVKPRVDSKELNREDIIELAKEFTYKHDLISYRYALSYEQGEKALEVDIGDLHVGAFSWEEETGENSDYKIIEGKTKEVVAKIKNLIEIDSRINTLYLVFGGDVLHVDNAEGTTSGGTQVQLDGRVKKMIRVAYRILSYIIIELAIVPNVSIKVLEGNHSRTLEFAVFEGLKMIFENNKHIDFDNSPMARKAFMYGNNLVGLAHGDLPNKKHLQWLQLDFREMWGKAKYAEIHLFHLHKEDSETTEGGITIRRNPTIKPTDHYEYFNAFIGADKKIACYIWDKEGGLDSIRYFRSMFTIK